MWVLIDIGINIGIALTTSGNQVVMIFALCSMTIAQIEIIDFKLASKVVPHTCTAVTLSILPVQQETNKNNTSKHTHTHTNKAPWSESSQLSLYVCCACSVIAVCLSNHEYLTNAHQAKIETPLTKTPVFPVEAVHS
jgi:hypothetical protein